MPKTTPLRDINITSKSDHESAPLLLKVNWMVNKLVSIAVKDDDVYGEIIKVELYNKTTPDKLIKQRAAQIYKKQGKKGLSVMIHKNQKDYEKLTDKMAKDE